MAKQKTNIWKFDCAYKKPIYYLGLIGTIFSGWIIWLLALGLWIIDHNNKEFKNEKIIGAKHMRTGLQKFLYIIGWIDVVILIIALILLVYFIPVLADPKTWA